MALWDKLTVAKNKRDVAETRSQTETEDTAKTQVRCKKKVDTMPRNCCENSYITKRSSEAPHLTELRLVIQLGNPAPVETKKKRQINKTAGAGGGGGRHSPNRPRPAPPKAGAQGPSLPAAPATAGPPTGFGDLIC